MKKYVDLSMIYGIAALIAGAFYREFTKFMNFQGVTRLSVLHTHLFVMGMVFFLLLTIFENNFSLSEHKNYKIFMLTYNIGFIITAITFAVRGILQVFEYEFTRTAEGMLSGIAGIGHILVTIGLVLFFMILRNRIEPVS